MLEFGSSPKVKCPTCNKVSSHKAVFSSDTVGHLRCSECNSIGVFGFEMVDDEKEDGDKKQKLTPLDHAALIERRGSEAMAAYSIKKAYTDADYLRHPQFSDGYVIAIVPPQKMEVLFAGGRKVLICGPGSISGMSRQRASSSTKKSKSGKVKKSSTAKRANLNSSAESGDEPVECPKCGKIVHPYNLSRNPKGRVVGCIHCNNM